MLFLWLFFSIVLNLFSFMWIDGLMLRSSIHLMVTPQYLINVNQSYKKNLGHHKAVL